MNSRRVIRCLLLCLLLCLTSLTVHAQGTRGDYQRAANLRRLTQNKVFRDRVRGMRIKEVVTAPRSPWQNAYVDRLIGSIRRECLDHIIIFNERHLREALSRYFHYHHKSRTPLSLDKDCPETRPIHPPTAGKIVAFPEVGGLHHRYERRAA